MYMDMDGHVHVHVCMCACACGACACVHVRMCMWLHMHMHMHHSRPPAEALTPGGRRARAAGTAVPYDKMGPLALGLAGRARRSCSSTTTCTARKMRHGAVHVKWREASSPTSKTANRSSRRDARHGEGPGPAGAPSPRQGIRGSWNSYPVYQQEPLHARPGARPRAHDTRRGRAPRSSS